MAFPSNGSGGEEIGLAAIGGAAIAEGFCGGGAGRGPDAGVPVVGAGIVLIDGAVILVRAGDLGGTGAIAVVLDCADMGVAKLDAKEIGGGVTARCFPFDTGGVGT